MSVTVRPELIFVAGPQRDDRAVLMNNLTIVGRSSHADVHIHEEFVSRRQLKFELTPEGWVVENLSRSSRMLINGRKYKPDKEVVLGSGDVIAVGVETEMLFVEPRDDPNEVLAAYRRDNPTGPSEPVPPPPSSAPAEEATLLDSTAPAAEAVLLDSPAAVKKPPGPKVEPRRKAKFRKYAIAFGIYILVLIAGALILMSIKKDRPHATAAQPPRLTAGDIEKAIRSDLHRSPNEVTAQRYLQQARALFLKRSAEEKNLYACTRSYRLYLAYRRADQRVFEPQDERNFGIAQRELVRKVQDIYDDAWAAENNRRWNDAYLELERLLRYLPVKETSDDGDIKAALVDNVLAHSRYVSRHLSKK